LSRRIRFDNDFQVIAIKLDEEELVCQKANYEKKQVDEFYLEELPVGIRFKQREKRPRNHRVERAPVERYCLAELALSVVIRHVKVCLRVSEKELKAIIPGLNRTPKYGEKVDQNSEQQDFARQLKAPGGFDHYYRPQFLYY
jgi:hypothetical protein